MVRATFGGAWRTVNWGGILKKKAPSKVSFVTIFKYVLAWWGRFRKTYGVAWVLSGKGPKTSNLRGSLEQRALIRAIFESVCTFWGKLE